MKSRKSKRGGFTLVEMLTVLVIIGVLASMIAGAVMFALNSVNQTVIRQEISQLEMALDTYKSEYGEYPPDSNENNQAYNHIMRCYRNVDKGHASSVAGQVNPATSLYIFLGPKNANPTKPFDWSSTVHQKAAIMDFNRSRVKQTNGEDVNWNSIDRNGQICAFVFMPRSCALPYIYFRGNMSNGVTNYDKKTHNGCVPYKDKHGQWYGDRKFQIICGGADNVYHDSGGDNIVKDGSIKAADLDNIVSFSQKQIRDLLD